MRRLSRRFSFFRLSLISRGVKLLFHKKANLDLRVKSVKAIMVIEKWVLCVLWVTFRWFSDHQKCEKNNSGLLLHNRKDHFKENRKKHYGFMWDKKKIIVKKCNAYHKCESKLYFSNDSDSFIFQWASSCFSKIITPAQIMEGVTSVPSKWHHWMPST